LNLEKLQTMLQTCSRRSAVFLCGEVAGFETRLAIDRLEYNVVTGKFYEMGVIGKDVDVLISFEATRKK